MTKSGSNALKQRARLISRAEGITYTQALARLNGTETECRSVWDEEAKAWTYCPCPDCAKDTPR